jgi:hypothetical protein
MNLQPDGSASVGFCSEHTVEYLLVPPLVRLLEDAYPVVIPLFVWLSREGRRGCSSVDSQRQVRILSVFPRRPKVRSTWQDAVLVKSNEDILAQAAHAPVCGIGTVAGVPLASSLFQFTSRCPIAWFLIPGEENVEESQFVKVPISTFTKEAHSARGVTGPVPTQAILDYVRSHCLPMRWSAAVSAIREIRHDLGREGYGGWSTGYRPFFLVISESPIEPAHT